MEKEINAVKARQKLGELIEEVYYRGDRVIIKRGNRAMAVMIPVVEYERYKKQRDEDFKVYHDLWALNKDAPIEEVEKDVEKAVEEVRQQASKSKPNHSK